MSEQADRDALVEALGEHSWDMTDEVKIDGAWTWVLCCECGEMPPMAEGHQHIADAILASDWLAQRDRRLRAEAVEAVAREWQFGGWPALGAPVPPGAIPALARGQIVTDWLRERASRIEGSDRG